MMGTLSTSATASVPDLPHGADATSVLPVRLGIAGLGRAFSLMLPTLIADPRITLVAGADARPENAARFAAVCGVRAHADFESLCRDPEVEAIYVATPHALHAEQAVAAARHGKHVLVEKPMALTLAECRAMIDAARAAGVHIVVGHSHSFDAPVRRARELIDAGAIGRVRMVNAQYYTDFMYRPRRPEELDTAAGGGVIWSQGAHQVDIVRLLAGADAVSVRAMTGNWDAKRPAEGAYGALIAFDGGAFASLLYSGYGHFDSSVFCDGIGELGQPVERTHYGAARRDLRRAGSAAAESAAKAARSDASFERVAADIVDGNPGVKAAPHHEHFGVVIVSGEHGDLRLLPHGVQVYGDDDVRLDALSAPAIARVGVVDELYAAVRRIAPPSHDGHWGMATLEICLSMLQSSHEQRDVLLCHQAAPRPLEPQCPK